MSGQQSAEGRTLLRKDFPNDPDDRLEAIFCSVNAESKSIVIARCLSPGEFRSEWDVFKLYTRWAGWPNYSLYFRQYMQETLVPIGLVAEEQVNISTTPPKVEIGWALTEAGENLGRPIAAAALRMAVRHDTSLATIFSKASSRYDNRAPGNTARILRAVDRGALKSVDVSALSGVDDTAMRNNLVRLQRAGLLNYATARTRPKHPPYEWVHGKDPKDVPPCRTIISRTRKVALALSEIRIGDAMTIASRLGYGHAQTVSPILQHLARLGFARPVGWTPLEGLSQVSLTELGRIWVRFIYDVEDALAGGSALEAMRDYLAQLDQSITWKAATIYWKACPEAHSQRAEKRISRLLSFIKEYQARHGMGPRNIEIRDALHKKNVSPFLTALVQRGVLVRTRSGPEVRYSTASQTTNAPDPSR